MTKRGTRAFFVASTLLSALIFLGLTIDSHRQFPTLTNAAAIDATVIAGKHVWHRKNCINCHTLLGEGAYYAPDLTKITTQRGAPYLREFLKDPSQFYSEERDGRLMPTLKLSDEEITEVIAFLGVGQQDRHPGLAAAPDPGAGQRGARGQSSAGRAATAASSDPVELGRVALQRDAARVRCLPLDRARRQHRGPVPGGHRRHRGGARARAGLPRQGEGRGRLHPRVDRRAERARARRARPTRPGAARSCPATTAQTLKPEQIDQIVAYLAHAQVRGPAT